MAGRRSVEKPSASTKKTLAVKAVFAALFIGGIAWLLRDKEPWAPFRRVQPMWLAASVGLSFVMVATSCLKWRLLLGLQGHRPPFRELMRLYFVGYFFSNLLPSNIGGDMVRSYYAGKRIGSQADAAVSVFLERFTGLMLLLLLAVLGPALRPSLYREPAVIIPVALAVVLLGVLAGMIVAKRPGAWAAPWVARLPGPLGGLAARVLGKAEHFHAKLRPAVKTLAGRRGTLLGVIGLTALFYVMTWLNIQVSFRAFAVEPEWSGIVAVTAVALLAASLPLAPLGGLGLVEFSLIYYFTLVGFQEDDTFAMSMLLRVKVMLLGLIGLGFYLAAGERAPRPRA